MGRGEDERERRRRAHDFWRAWREEQRRAWKELAQEERVPGALPPEQAARAWREFFHGFMHAWPEAHWVFGGRRFSPWHQGMDTFNPFVANLLSKGGGLLPLVVLQLLSRAPRYGNELMELIARRTGGGWMANPGAIYPLMTQLEERGLVQGKWEDPQKRTIRQYTLTAEGRLEVSRMVAVLRPKLEEAIEVLQAMLKDMDASTAGMVGAK